MRGYLTELITQDNTILLLHEPIHDKVWITLSNQLGFLDSRLCCWVFQVYWSFQSRSTSLQLSFMFGQEIWGRKEAELQFSGIYSVQDNTGHAGWYRRQRSKPEYQSAHSKQIQLGEGHYPLLLRDDSSLLALTEIRALGNCKSWGRWKKPLVHANNVMRCSYWLKHARKEKNKNSKCKTGKTKPKAMTATTERAKMYFDFGLNLTSVLFCFIVFFLEGGLKHAAFRCNMLIF